MLNIKPCFCHQWSWWLVKFLRQKKVSPSQLNAASVMKVKSKNASLNSSFSFYEIAWKQTKLRIYKCNLVCHFFFIFTSFVQYIYELYYLLFPPKFLLVIGWYCFANQRRLATCCYNVSHGCKECLHMVFSLSFGIMVGFKHNFITK